MTSGAESKGFMREQLLARVEQLFEIETHEWRQLLPDGRMVRIINGKKDAVAALDPRSKVDDIALSITAIYIDDRCIARIEGSLPKRLGLKATIADNKTSSKVTVRPNTEHLRIVANRNNEILEVYYFHGDVALMFSPPEGSKAATRLAAMEQSRAKRWLLPLLTGLGKAGWAIAAFILGPILAQFIGWLWDLLPDFDIPWPDIHIPWPHFHIPWPEIHIPWPHFHIPWPEIHIPWPDIELPDWLVFLIEHPKMWIPILIGLFIGIGSVRANKKATRATTRSGDQPQKDQLYQRFYQDLLALEQRSTMAIQHHLLQEGNRWNSS